MKHQGFTLVEVIVVATIVAILALSMVQIYTGYVEDSRQQVVQNSAASAATYLNAAENLGVDIANDLVSPLDENSEWSTPSAGGGEPSVFRSPAGVVITINNGAGTVSAMLSGHTSSPVRFR